MHQFAACKSVLTLILSDADTERVVRLYSIHSPFNPNQALSVSQLGWIHHDCTKRISAKQDANEQADTAALNYPSYFYIDLQTY